MNGPPADIDRRQLLLIVAGMMTVLFLAALDQTVVATALPQIARELDAVDQLSWVVTAYVLGVTASIPLYGKLGDMYGRKLLLQIALVIFAVSSIGCAIAQSVVDMSIYRAVQGLGGGGLTVLTSAILGSITSPRERGRLQAYTGAAWAFGSILGPVVGGILTDLSSWRWIFAINVPIAVVCLVVITKVLPASARERRARFDVAGALLLMSAASSIVLVVTWGGTTHPWLSMPMLGLIASTIAILGVLYLVERRAEEPVVPVQLRRIRTFNLSVASTFFSGATLLCTTTFIPVYFQVVRGETATTSGALILPLLLTQVFGSMVCGQIMSRTGRYRLLPVVGAAPTIVGALILAAMTDSTTTVTAFVSMGLIGLGTGMSISPLTVATQNAISLRDIGAGTSMLVFSRTLGGAIGVAAFGAVLSQRLSPQAVEAIHRGTALGLDGGVATALMPIFVGLVPLALLTMTMAWFVVEQPLRSTSQAQDLAAARAMSA